MCGNMKMFSLLGMYFHGNQGSFLCIKDECRASRQAILCSGSFTFLGRKWSHKRQLL